MAKKLARFESDVRRRLITALRLPWTDVSCSSPVIATFSDGLNFRTTASTRMGRGVCSLMNIPFTAPPHTFRIGIRSSAKNDGGTKHNLSHLHSATASVEVSRSFPQPTDNGLSFGLGRALSRCTGRHPAPAGRLGVTVRNR